MVKQPMPEDTAAERAAPQVLDAGQSVDMCLVTQLGVEDVQECTDNPEYQGITLLPSALCQSAYEETGNELLRPSISATCQRASVHSGIPRGV